MNQAPNNCIVGSRPLPNALLAKEMPLHNTQMQVQTAVASAETAPPQPQTWLPPLVPQQLGTSYSPNPTDGSVPVPDPARLQQVEAMLAHVIEQNRQLMAQQQYIQSAHLQVVQKLQNSFDMPCASMQPSTAPLESGKNVPNDFHFSVTKPTAQSAFSIPPGLIQSSTAFSKAKTPSPPVLVQPTRAFGVSAFEAPVQNGPSCTSTPSDVISENHMGQSSLVSCQSPFTCELSKESASHDEDASAGDVHTSAPRSGCARRSYPNNRRKSRCGFRRIVNGREMVCRSTGCPRGRNRCRYESVPNPPEGVFLPLSEHEGIIRNERREQRRLRRQRKSMLLKSQRMQESLRRASPSPKPDLVEPDSRRLLLF